MKRNRFGRAFGDEFSRSSTQFKHFKHNSISSSWQDATITNFHEDGDSSLTSPWRKIVFFSVLMVVFLMLFVRLFHLQVVEGKYNRELADSNRIQVRVIHAPRGVIYDRNGKIIAANAPGFRLTETKENGSKKVVHISRDDALKMEVSGDPRLKDLEVDNIRTYPMGEKTAHMIGYVGEITQEELDSPNFKNYKPSGVDIVSHSPQ